MNDIIREYRVRSAKYRDFSDKVSGLIKELLINSNLKFHKIEARAKGIRSLMGKLSRKHGYYNSLNDITDLVGVRIITYLEDEVDIIAELIDREFDKDESNSVDKRKIDNEKFGYKSLHRVVSLNSVRKELTEYRRFAGIKFEIQIRSILQHAWAEIEHDLGYKSENSIPDDYKRDFLRVAALLELADREFINIKQGLLEYDVSIDQKIDDNETAKYVDINKLSLRSFVKNNKNVKLFNEKISDKFDVVFHDDEFDQSYVERLQYFGINTIEGLNSILSENIDKLIDFGILFLSDRDSKITELEFSNGISIFYLGYLLATKSGDPNILSKYLQENYLSSTNTDYFINKLLGISKKIGNTQDY